MWQYSSTGSVNGIDGDVDLNIYFPEKLNVSSLRPRKSAGRREFFLDRRQRRAIIVVHTTMYLQLFIPFILFSGGVYGHYGTENHQDRARGGKAGAAPRCAREGVGTAEIDLIHALRHHPGCTQAALLPSFCTLTMPAIALADEKS